MTTPQPTSYDPRDLSEAWSGLSTTARRALARLCQHGDPLGTSVAEELHAAGMVTANGTVWAVSPRGMVMYGMALGAGVLP